MDTVHLPNVTTGGGEGGDSAARVVSQVVPPFLMLVGIIGPVLTIRALCKSEVLTTGPQTYFVMLAVADLSAMALSLTRFWVVTLADFDLFSSPTVVCKVLPFLESSSLMVPPWLLVTMALQVLAGLRMKVKAGDNISPWKARVYSIFVIFIALVVNAHHLIFFHSGEETRKSEERSGRGNISTNSTVDLASHGKHIVRDCVPSSAEYHTFYFKVWPWMSLGATLSVPLLVSVVLCIWILRMLVTRSMQGNEPPLSVSFRQIIVGVLVSCLVTVLISGPVCGFSFLDATKYWSDSSYTVLSRERGTGLLAVWFVVRLVYYVQFCFRWMVTCYCCQLWSLVRSMCRCKKAGS